MTERLRGFSLQQLYLVGGCHVKARCDGSGAIRAEGGIDVFNEARQLSSELQRKQSSD
jgi:hypothetical protein